MHCQTFCTAEHGNHLQPKLLFIRGAQSGGYVSSANGKGHSGARRGEMAILSAMCIFLWSLTMHVVGGLSVFDGVVKENTSPCRIVTLELAMQTHLQTFEIG